MKQRPILFFAHMVRALLDGSKTQLRRVVKPQPFVDNMGNACWNGSNFGQGGDGKPHFNTMASPFPSSKTGRVHCPYGAPGDQLWVREVFRFLAVHDHVPPRELASGPIWCEAQDDVPFHPTGFGKLRPSIFMPRWASRITIEITGVRVERLQDISEADALAEGVYDGVPCRCMEPIDFVRSCGKCGGRLVDAVDLYRQLWESINGPGSWDANPWVRVIEFKKVSA